MYMLQPVRRQIDIRVIRNIKEDDLAGAFDTFSIDQGCGYNVEQYDMFFKSDLLDKYDPKKNMYVVDRQLKEWVTNNVCHKN